MLPTCSCSSIRLLAALAVFFVSARVLNSLARLAGGSSVSQWHESGEELSGPCDSGGGAGALYFFRDLSPRDGLLVRDCRSNNDYLETGHKRLRPKLQNH